jgi:hypothetical protein
MFVMNFTDHGRYYRILREGFVCTNGTDIQPQSYCNAGPYFNGTFSGGQIVNVSQ